MFLLGLFAAYSARQIRNEAPLSSAGWWRDTQGGRWVGAALEDSRLDFRSPEVKCEPSALVSRFESYREPLAIVVFQDGRMAGITETGQIATGELEALQLPADGAEFFRDARAQLDLYPNATSTERLVLVADSRVDVEKILRTLTLAQEEDFHRLSIAGSYLFRFDSPTLGELAASDYCEILDAPASEVVAELVGSSPQSWGSYLKAKLTTPGGEDDPDLKSPFWK